MKWEWNCMGDIFLGVLLILTGGAINNLGIVLQKRQVNLHKQLSSTVTGENLKQKPESYGKDKIWVLGILMQVILAVPFLFIGLDELGLTLAQPLSNACIIFLVIGLVVIVKETMRLQEIIGAIILVGGMIAVGAAGVTGSIGLNEFLSTKLLIFTILLVIIATILVILIIVMKKVQKIKIIAMGLLSGTIYSIVSICTQTLMLSFEDLSQIGTIIMLLVSLIGVVIGTIAAIWVTQEAFKISRAINFVPWGQITINLIPIFTGLTAFGQTILYPVVFWGGTLAIIIAASLLARFQE
jgi:drug/metabolite transporter (DMT)-like permease